MRQADMSPEGHAHSAGAQREGITMGSGDRMTHVVDLVLEVDLRPDAGRRHEVHEGRLAGLHHLPPPRVRVEVRRQVQRELRPEVGVQEQQLPCQLQSVVMSGSLQKCCYSWVQPPDCAGSRTKRMLYYAGSDC